jgi:hypothetical protein
VICAHSSYAALRAGFAVGAAFGKRKSQRANKALQVKANVLNCPPHADVYEALGRYDEAIAESVKKATKKSKKVSAK